MKIYTRNKSRKNNTLSLFCILFLKEKNPPTEYMSVLIKIRKKKN